MVSKIYKVWLEHVEAPAIERGKIRQFCVGIVPISMGYGQFDASGHRRYCGMKTNLTPADCMDIVERFDARVERDGGPLATRDQAELGRKWLTDSWKHYRMPELDYSTIECFRFANVIVVTENQWRAVVIPEYDCCFPDGSVLRYAPTSWMSDAHSKYLDWNWERKPVTT